MLNFILVLISFAVFLIYNISICVSYGVPKSLSESFYLLNSTKKHLGYLFTAFIYIICFALVPAWLDLSAIINPNFMFLAFLTVASLLFVGAAPAFRNFPLESKVHSVAAVCSAVFALAWCISLGWHNLLLVGSSVLGTLFISLITGSADKAHWNYWLEIAVFLCTYLTISTQYIALLSI